MDKTSNNEINCVPDTKTQEEIFHQSVNAARFMNSYHKAVNYLSALDIDQLSAVNISANTMHWLKTRQVRFVEDPDPNATMRMCDNDKKELVIQSSENFRKVLDETLAWSMFFWIKDIDQFVKGKQDLKSTPLKDMDDKFWEMVSHHEVPFIPQAFSMALQLMFLPKIVSKHTADAAFEPAIAIVAHNIITDRCDKFASLVTGKTYKNFIDNVSLVENYTPIIPPEKNIFYGPRSDKKRIRNTSDVVEDCRKLRELNNIPEYNF